MNIHRNVLMIVAGVLLMTSLPAGAQVLGGSLGGGINGTLGGRLGGAGVNGNASGAANAGIDASGTLGAALDRTHQAATKTRDVAGGAVGATRSRVESARNAADASIETAASAGAKTSHRAARTAARARASAEQDSAVQTNAQPRGGLPLSGSGETSAQQHVMRHSIAAEGAAGSQTSVDRSGLANGVYGEAGLSVKKQEPTPAETPPAQ